VEDTDEPADRKPDSRFRSHLIGFIIVSLAAIAFLSFLGAPPLLILEVFGFAAILAISAILIIIIYGGGMRIRWRGMRGRRQE
jgi:hypothetical protein